MPGRAYRLYGLAVESQLALTGPPAAPARRFDVRLRAGTAKQFNRARRMVGLASSARDWFESRRLPDGTTYLRWNGLFEFLVSPDGRLISYQQFPRASRESFNNYLLGQVLSFSLLSAGIESLHATAVVVDGGAIAFLGNCGFGKSTLGAAFLARGFPILTDDVLALERREAGWIAHAGPPRLKLFPSIAQRLLATGSGTMLNPTTSKLILRLKGRQWTGEPVPLKALYVLRDPVSTSRSPLTRVTLRPLTGQKAFLEVIRAAFNLIRCDRARLENQFAVTTRLAAEVPIRRLSYPRRLSSLTAVCEAVLADVAADQRGHSHHAGSGGAHLSREEVARKASG